jgi:hypothetical protein
MYLVLRISVYALTLQTISRNCNSLYCDMMTIEAIRCYAVAGKQHTTDGFRGNRYAHNKILTDENGLYFWVSPESI